MSQKVVNITGGPRYDHVTFLLCNPRSRSAWLREVMSHCMPCLPHEVLRTCGSVSDLACAIDRVREEPHDRPAKPLFVADTAAILLYERIRDTMPGANFMFVYRPPSQVDSSLRALGLKPVFEPAKVATKMLRVYQELRRSYVPPLWFTCDSLSDYETHVMMCERMGGVAMNRTQFERMVATNIQADLAAYRRQTHPLRALSLASEFQL